MYAQRGFSDLARADKYLYLLKCLVLAGFGCLVLSGCSARQKLNLLPSIPLLPPEALGHHWQLTQSVTLYHEANRTEVDPQSVLLAWSVTDQGLNAVGLSASGQTLMTLGYDGEHFEEAYSPLLPASLPGRQILAQLQLSYWPLAVVNQQLKSSPWQLLVNGNKRELYLAKRKILDIQITPADDVIGTGEIIEITNTAMHSRLVIKTLTRTLLP